MPQIMDEFVKFLREVSQVQFVGWDVPVIMQRLWRYVWRWGG